MAYIHDGILVIKKNETLPFATTRMDLEGIILSEISQSPVLCYHLYVKSKNKTNE